MTREKIFEYELSQIKNQSIREFTVKALSILPDYFFKVPASSTGKYHPKFSLDEGGLIRHTYCAVYIALELFNFHTLQNYTNDEKDMVISALILHDGAKHGLEGSNYTVTEHPLVVADLIKNNMDIMNTVDFEISDTIIRCIKSHMSEWNKDFKTKKEVLPLPQTHIQKFVALCDYISSRKNINMDFNYRT